MCFLNVKGIYGIDFSVKDACNIFRSNYTKNKNLFYVVISCTNCQYHLWIYNCFAFVETCLLLLKGYTWSLYLDFLIHNGEEVIRDLQRQILTVLWKPVQIHCLNVFYLCSYPTIHMHMKTHTHTLSFEK